MDNQSNVNETNTEIKNENTINEISETPVSISSDNNVTESEIKADPTTVEPIAETTTVTPVQTEEVKTETVEPIEEPTPTEPVTETTTVAPVQTEEVKTAEPTAKPKKNKTLLYVIVVLLVVAAIAATILFLNPSFSNNNTGNSGNNNQGEVNNNNENNQANESESNNETTNTENNNTVENNETETENEEESEANTDGFKSYKQAVGQYYGTEENGNTYTVNLYSNGSFKIVYGIKLAGAQTRIIGSYVINDNKVILTKIQNHSGSGKPSFTNETYIINYTNGKYNLLKNNELVVEELTPTNNFKDEAINLEVKGIFRIYKNNAPEYSDTITNNFVSINNSDKMKDIDEIVGNYYYSNSTTTIRVELYSTGAFIIEKKNKESGNLIDMVLGTYVVNNDNIVLSRLVQKTGDNLPSAEPATYNFNYENSNYTLVNYENAPTTFSIISKELDNSKVIKTMEKIYDDLNN